MLGSSINATNVKNWRSQSVSERSINMVGNSYPPFATSFFSFHASIRYIVPFVATLPFHSLLPSFRFNSFFPFVVPPFQRFPSIPYLVPFVSTLPFHSVLPSFRFNPYIPFVAASLRLKLFILLRPSSRFNSMFATSSLSFQLFPSVRSFLPFNSLLSNLLQTSFWQLDSRSAWVIMAHSWQTETHFPSVRCWRGGVINWDE